MGPGGFGIGDVHFQGYRADWLSWTPKTQGRGGKVVEQSFRPTMMMALGGVKIIASTSTSTTYICC